MPYGDPFDDNWLLAEATVAAGGFQGTFPLNILAQEILSFRDALRALHATLFGEATFEPLEQQLRVCVRGDGRGGITVSGEASAESGSPTYLTFAFDLDQSYLRESLRQLDEMVLVFPLRTISA